MEHKTNYIVVLYMGHRRTSNVSAPLVMLHKHLDFLQQNKIPLQRVTVVVNCEQDADFAALADTITYYDNYYVDLKVRMRHNSGFSYGGWNDTINACIEEGDDFTEYFLIEDDYVPVVHDFLDIFRSRMIDNVAFVCQKVFYNTHGVYKHAAISNGLLAAPAALRSYNIYGSALSVLPAKTYADAEWNQVHFLELIQEVGFDMTDISDIASVEFLSRQNSGYVKIEHGNATKPAVLEPIVV